MSPPATHKQSASGESVSFSRPWVLGGLAGSRPEGREAQGAGGTRSASSGTGLPVTGGRARPPGGAQAGGQRDEDACPQWTSAGPPGKGCSAARVLSRGQGPRQGPTGCCQQDGGSPVTALAGPGEPCGAATQVPPLQGLAEDRVRVVTVTLRWLRAASCLSLASSHGPAARLPVPTRAGAAPAGGEPGCGAGVVHRRGRRVTLLAPQAPTPLGAQGHVTCSTGREES